MFIGSASLAEPALFDKALTDLVDDSPPIIGVPSTNDAIISFGLRTARTTTAHPVAPQAIPLPQPPGKTPTLETQNTETQFPPNDKQRTGAHLDSRGFPISQDETFYVERTLPQSGTQPTQSSQTIDTRDYLTEERQASSQNNFFSQCRSVSQSHSPSTTDARKKKALLQPTQDARLGTNRAYELRRQINLTRFYQSQPQSQRQRDNNSR